MTKRPNLRETAGASDLKAAAEIISACFSEEGWARTSIHVPREMMLAIYVNRQELGTLRCTPVKLDCLVLGFLYAERIISGLGEVADLRISEEESLAEVTLSNPDKLPRSTGETVSQAQVQKVDPGLVAAPAQVLSLIRQFQEQMRLYQLCGGIHTSALSDASGLLVVAEDIGRHNTLDKIQGECLLRNLSTRGLLLLSTARFSSQMLLKAAKMGVSIIVSRHPPTASAVSLARDLGITLVGHLWSSKLSVYSHPERLSCPTGYDQLKPENANI